MRQHLIDGLYIFKKPAGISSAGFLETIKKRYAVSKIGHGGTLDPFASGVLMVGIGRSYTQRLSEMLTRTTKEYKTSIVLGASSSTDDCTGEIIGNGSVAPVDRVAITHACDRLQKITQQVPPRFSAVKIGGVPAYAHARRGKTAALKPKEARLYEYCIDEVRRNNDGMVEVKMTLVVSSGFYIRSFARDLGEMLGVGGYVDTLVRTRVGDFSLERAFALEDVGADVEMRGRWEGRVQGIGFRDFICTAAKRMRVAGFVRNLPDGSVESTGQGTMEDVIAFWQSVNADHACARIEKTLICFQKPIEKYKTFLIAA